MICPRCGEKAIAKPDGCCYCIFCGYTGDVKGFDVSLQKYASWFL